MGPMEEHLMLRVNSTTTFAEIHPWIANYFNSTYRGTDDGSSAIGGVSNNNDPHMIAFNNWMARRRKGYNNLRKGWSKGKNDAKDKGAGKKGDYNRKGAGKHEGKNNTVTFNVCGKTGRYSSQC
eukprot:4149721-Amphidinium_carterae.1